MIEKVLPDIYRIDIPLPKTPLKVTNSYFIRGQERNLLIDTGFNCKESRQAMDQALHELGVNMETTDLFITHLHADHSGLIKYLATPDTTVWMSEIDAGILMHSQIDSKWSLFRDFLDLSGLIASGIGDDIEKHPGFKFNGDYFDKFTLVKEGDVIRVGNYCFQCVATRGHTAGHMCLYEPEKKLLIAGDHILGRITPNITLWRLGDDVLGNYLHNLDKINTLEVDLVLPGHRHILTDCRGRISELKAHHKKRLDAVMNIVGDKKMDAAQVASLMKWNLSYKNWEQFPWEQKLFATGETMSHLYHLAVTGKLIISTVDGIVYFARNGLAERALEA